MTAEERAAIWARVDAATKGPWHAPGMGEIHTDHEHGVFVGEDQYGQPDPVIGDLCTHHNCDENAEFIAHARSDVPDLLDALEASEARVKALGAALRDLIDAIPAETLAADPPLGAWCEVAESVLRSTPEDRSR